MSNLDTDNGCTLCHRNGAQLAELAKTYWECSHVDCKQRKQLTAAPPRVNALDMESSGCCRVRPVFLKD